MIRRIAICTPLKGEIPPFYHRNLVNVMTAHTDIAFCHLLVEGVAVHWARNIGVARAQAAGCVEIVFIDKDLDVNREMLDRLLAHEHVKVVCGLYAQRYANTKWMFDDPVVTGELVRVSQSAIGFSKIRMSVFNELALRNPWRKGLIVDELDGQRKQLAEFFPMELVGRATPAAKIPAIESILESDANPEAKLADIHREIQFNDTSENIWQAEDYGFCRLLREAGIPMHIDPEIVVQHETKLKLPLSTVQLEKMLAEPWRQKTPCKT